jgi:3-oxoacyl-[acyl-carrier protein] reductase
MQKTGGGAMVHISSIQCLRGDDKPQDAYQAAKAGMLALSKSLAIQFAGDKIRSNCILPGPVESPMQDRWRENPAQKNAVAGGAARLSAQPGLADAALFRSPTRPATYGHGTYRRWRPDGAGYRVSPCSLFVLIISDLEL